MTKKRIQAVLKQVCCILLSIIVIAPFYMVFINSFKDRTGAARMDLALPTDGCSPITQRLSSRAV